MEDEIVSLHTILETLLRRIRIVEGNVVILGSDIGEVKGSIAKLNAKLAVNAREDNKQKPIKMDDVIMDLILKGKAVDVTEMIPSQHEESQTKVLPTSTHSEQV